MLLNPSVSLKQIEFCAQNFISTEAAFCLLYVCTGLFVCMYEGVCISVHAPQSNGASSSSTEVHNLFEPRAAMYHF